ncbi:MAG: HEAT repeat domain-containing protein [Chloroflexi bacterium]|nr:HEAT repeat domain-containing protein [Chloroflexota bacterium]
MTEDFVKWMQDFANSAHPDFREGIQQDVDAIIEHGGISFDSAKALLESKETDAKIRSTCVWLLSRYDAQRIAPTLIPLLDSEVDRVVRIQAIIDLGIQNAGDAVDPLLNLLRADKDQQIRALSAYALGEIGDSRVADELIAILVDQSENADVRGHIAEALINLDMRDKAIPALVSVLHDEDPSVRFWAVFALGEIGSMDEIPHLQKLIADDSPIPHFHSVGREAMDTIQSIINRHNS